MTKGLSREGAQLWPPTDWAGQLGLLDARGFGAAAAYHERRGRAELSEKYRKLSEIIAAEIEKTALQTAQTEAMSGHVTESWRSN